MEKVYTLIDWENAPNTSTPLGKTNLRKVDYAVNVHDDRIIALDTAKANQATVNNVVKEITYEESTGILTITKVNNTSTQIDTKLEKLAVNFSYDPETEELIIALDDGTEQRVDLSALITQYEFMDTDTVSFLVQTDGKIKAEVIDGSITADKLEPNYLADIIVQANIAVANADKSKRYAVGGVESGDTTDNAKYYKEQAELAKIAAEQARDEAESIVGVGIATDSAIGLVKGNGNVSVKTDGAMWADQYKDKGTATGTSVQFTDADDALIAITAMGGTGSVDVVARNKNNLPYPYKDSTKTTSGITYTVLIDGGITISGTASANADFYIFGQNTDAGQYYFIPKGDYTITGTSSGPSTGAALICSDKDGAIYYNNTQLINALKTKDCYLFRIMLRVSSGTIMSGNLYLQIERGNVVSSYETPKSNTLTIPDVTTAVYPLYLTSYKGITNVFTLSSSQSTFTAVAKSELWANNYNLHNGDITSGVDTITVDTEIVKGKLSWLFGVIKYKLAALATAISGKFSLITNATDPNTAPVGIFYFNGTVNAPSFWAGDKSGYGICTKYDDDWIVQCAMSFHGSGMAYRSKMAGSWNEWVKEISVMDISTTDTENSTTKVAASAVTYQHGIDINDLKTEEDISLTFVSGVTGKCYKNHGTGLIKFTITINSPMSNPTLITTLPSSVKPSDNIILKGVVKQASGWGRCNLFIG